MSYLKQGQIVFVGKSKQGKNITLRYIEDADAGILCQYINALSQERTFIHFQGEQITLEEETAYIKEQVERMKHHRTVQLVALCENTIMGVAGLDMKDSAENHVGEFGISIAQGYRGEGIGTLLMDAVLKEAEENIPELQIVVLDVFSNNTTAIAMYEKFGFVTYGRLPNGMQHSGVFVDTIKMYRNVRLTP
jgi:RimJ/RimL family protein N-acetyltransferase